MIYGEKISVFCLLILIFTFVPLVNVFANVSCECGEHAKRITARNVDGTDCCKDTPGSNDFEYTYVQQANGTWQFVNTITISRATA